jgi:hypothetical protein
MASSTNNPLINPEVLTKVDVNINTSTSKYMWTFGGANRFRDRQKTSEQFFYDLPSLIGRNRSTSLGYGGRSDFTSAYFKGKTSNYYNIPSDFDQNRIYTHMPKISFGKGREDCKRSERNPIPKGVPGPGTYDVRPKFANEANKFSLFGREWATKDQFKHTRSIPGPGAYNETNHITGKGKYPDSTYKNTRMSGFGNLERFKYSSNKNPPPNAYNLGSFFNNTGFQYSSKYHSNIAKTMGNRPTAFYRPYKASGTPGPGSYDFFSDFEGFQREKYRFKWKKGKGKKSKKEKKDENKKTNDDKREKNNNDNENKKKNDDNDVKNDNEPHNEPERPNEEHVVEDNVEEN